MSAATRLLRPSTLHRVAGAAAAVTFALLLAAGPAFGASPKRLTAQLTDDVGALGGGRAAVEQAQARLLADAKVQLWVWFTDTMGGVAPSDFAVQTANLNGFGGNDLLVVIAMSDRAYGFARPTGWSLSDARIGDLISSDLEPGLLAGDNAGAVVAFADALRAELTGAAVETPTTTAAASAAPSTAPGPDGGGSGGGSMIGTLVAIILVVGLIAAAGWWFLYRRSARPGGPVVGTPAAPGDDLAAMSPKELDELANQLLVTTDDAIRDSETELGFAQAQFGEEEAAPFKDALVGAKADLKAAFTLRQQLDDDVPEDAATRRRMLSDLVRGCRGAQKRLDDEKQHFEELRAIERQAPEILAKLPAQADALEARQPAAQETMTHLAIFADASWQPVAANLDEARKRIAAVRAAVDEGTKAAAAGDGSTAGHAARLGQDALGQAAAFLDAIDRLARELDTARANVDGAIAEGERDLAAARKILAAGPADAAASARLDEAETLLAGARSDLNEPKPDVGPAYDKARQADAIVDEVAAAVRTAQEQGARDAARLESSIRSAQVAVTRASDYVTTRRGGVGGEARTRLAEAQRHLDEAVALGPTDPTAAAREADQASSLAAEASRLAESDYDRWDDPWRGGPRGGGVGGGGGGDIAGTVLGGIIGAILSGSGGGGRRGGGLPGLGGGGGGFGGFGGGWGGGGGHSGGGFSGGGGRW